MKQFGVPYDTIDISTTSITSAISDYQLIIVGHTGLDVNGTFLSSGEMSSISTAVNAGSGFFSMDGDLATSGNSSRYSFTSSIFGFGYSGSYSTQSSIAIPSSGHYITAAQAAPTSYTVRNSMQGDIVTTPGSVTTLAYVGSNPLMMVTNYGSGRAVQWTSDTWINNAVVGQFQGMDDLVWRGLVWAARKPFVLRGTPPMVSMRVDDVTGDALGARNFAYVDIANQYGFAAPAVLLQFHHAHKGVSHADMVQ